VLQFDGISPKKRLAGRFVLKAKFGGFQFARSEKKKLRNTPRFLYLVFSNQAKIIKR
jgi:hypothetical protein